MRERKFAKRAFGGWRFWAPAWGEVRDINHTSQLPISAFSLVSSQQLGQLARGVCGWRWGAGLRRGSDWECEAAGRWVRVGLEGMGVWGRSESGFESPVCW